MDQIEEETSGATAFVAAGEWLGITLSSATCKNVGHWPDSANHPLDTHKINQRQQRKLNESSAVSLAQAKPSGPSLLLLPPELELLAK